MPEKYIAALRESELCFRNLIEKNADAIMVVRQSGLICFANPAAEALIGRPAGELVGEMFGIPLTPDEITEIDIPLASGDTRVAEMRVVETVWEGERGFLASLHDVTERKQAADALRFLAEASRQLAGSLDYPKTIDSVASLAVEHLADWCMIDLLEEHSVSVRRVAVKHADPSKQDLAEQLHENWSPMWDAADGLPRVLSTGDPRIYFSVNHDLLESLTSDAAKLAVFQELGCKSAMLVPLVARGKILGAVTFISATASHRYTNPDLALARDLANRGALAIDNARLYDDAQIAVRRRDEFLAMLAHELRNPLAAIQNAVDVLRVDSVRSVRQERAQDVIERQGQHMARLLDDLLDIARVTGGKIQLRKQVCDVRKAVQDAVDASRSAVEARGHRLTLVLPECPLLIDADCTRMEQVIVNLLHNASKYTEPGGDIRLEASRLHDEVVLRVTDTGVGIAPEDLAHIFDLFVQTERTLDRSHGGLGIGLTLVRKLVEMHGGRVTASSRGNGHGSEFSVHLPAVQHQPLANQQADGAAGPDCKRIVIVEDNIDTRDMLQCLLSLEGHQVDVAGDGLTGVETITRCRPDVALVDIGLPGVDGYEVARRIRKAGNTAVVLVAVSGYGQAEDTQRALAAGFNQHLVKPVKHQELAKAIAAAFQGST